MPVVFPQLPSNVSDLPSVVAWIGAATQILNTLMGNIGSNGHASTVTVTSQGSPTQVVPTGLKDGDLWIALPVTAGQTLQRSIWSDGAWVLMNGQW